MSTQNELSRGGGGEQGPHVGRRFHAVDSGKQKAKTALGAVERGVLPDGQSRLFVFIKRFVS